MQVLQPIVQQLSSALSANDMLSFVTQILNFIFTWLASLFGLAA